MKSTTLAMFALATLAGSAFAGPVLKITEMSSKSAANPEDYFEITNLGDAAIDITGWMFDDIGADLGDAVGLNGITSIAAGESVIFFGLDEQDPGSPAYDPAGEVALFRSYWSGLSGVQVGYYAGTGLGKNDAINIFDDLGVLQLTQAYGDTSPNATHAGDWAAGNWDGSDTYENHAAIWDPNTDTFVLAQPGVLGSYANVFGEYGNPGSVPSPATMALLGLGGLVAGRRRR